MTHDAYNNAQTGSPVYFWYTAYRILSGWKNYESFKSKYNTGHVLFLQKPAMTVKETTMYI